MSKAVPLNEETADDASLNLIALAKTFGAKSVDYDEGVFVAEFTHKKAVFDFTDALEMVDFVDQYEIRAAGEPEESTDIEGISDDTVCLVLVYVLPEYVQYDPYEMELADDEVDVFAESIAEKDENGVIQESVLLEVKRRIKVNSRGVKRVKMQCNRGYKWDNTQRTCVKIGGAELAQKRKSIRRALLTKRSMGVSFKRRVERKTRKAMRYRKNLGLR